VGGDDALNVVELLDFPGMVRRVGVGVLVEELVWSDFAERPLIGRTLPSKVVVQSKVEKGKVMFVGRPDLSKQRSVVEGCRRRSSKLSQPAWNKDGLRILRIGGFGAWPWSAQRQDLGGKGTLLLVSAEDIRTPASASIKNRPAGWHNRQ
jgi:hypothetical protein